MGGKNLILSGEERDFLLEKEPMASKYIRPYIETDEFINNKERYCLWLEKASPADLKKLPLVMKRIKKVRAFRLSSKKAATRRWADMPMLFTENRL